MSKYSPPHDSCRSEGENEVLVPNAFDKIEINANDFDTFEFINCENKENPQAQQSQIVNNVSSHPNGGISTETEISGSGDLSLDIKIANTHNKASDYSHEEITKIIRKELSLSPRQSYPHNAKELFKGNGEISSATTTFASTSFSHTHDEHDLTDLPCLEETEEPVLKKSRKRTHNDASGISGNYIDNVIEDISSLPRQSCPHNAKELFKGNGEISSATTPFASTSFSHTHDKPDHTNISCSEETEEPVLKKSRKETHNDTSGISDNYIDNVIEDISLLPQQSYPHNAKEHSKGNSEINSAATTSTSTSFSPIHHEPDQTDISCLEENEKPILKKSRQELKGTPESEYIERTCKEIKILEEKLKTLEEKSKCIDDEKERKNIEKERERKFRYIKKKKILVKLCQCSVKKRDRVTELQLEKEKLIKLKETNCSLPTTSRELSFPVRKKTGECCNSPRHVWKKEVKEQERRKEDLEKDRKKINKNDQPKKYERLSRTINALKTRIDRKKLEEKFYCQHDKLCKEEDSHEQDIRKIVAEMSGNEKTKLCQTQGKGGPGVRTLETMSQREEEYSYENEDMDILNQYGDPATACITVDETENGMAKVTETTTRYCKCIKSKI